MEIIILLFLIGATAAAVWFFYQRRKQKDEKMAEFFKKNRMISADGYKSELPPNKEWENLVCRKVRLPARSFGKVEVHWCQYRVMTGKYTTVHNKVYVHYAVISFPKQIVSPEFTEKIRQAVKKSGDKFKGEMLDRIKKDSERPTKAVVLPNGDLATYWTSRNDVEDAELKLNWTKKMLLEV